MKQRIIKKSLSVGQLIVCKLSGMEVYRGRVTDILDETEALVQREDEIIGNHDSGGWIVRRNSTGSWDGCIERGYSGWHYYRRSNGRQYNRRTGGSWLYSEDIEDWSKLLG